eukprot:1179822-Prorocentrum_minimum.AAC.1
MPTKKGRVQYGRLAGLRQGPAVDVTKNNKILPKMLPKITTLANLWRWLDLPFWAFPPEVQCNVTTQTSPRSCAQRPSPPGGWRRRPEPAAGPRCAVITARPQP